MTISKVTISPENLTIRLMYLAELLKNGAKTWIIII